MFLRCCRLPAGAIIAFVLAVWCVIPGCRRESKVTPAPRGQDFNLLLITLDTTRADHLGCYGDESAETPNLDRLAADGVRFERCETCVPITLPSHCSIMTGTYPFYHGVRDNGSYRLHGGNVTLAELLSRLGYDTSAVLGSFVLNAKYGIGQGFDRYLDLESPEGGALDAHGNGNERKANEVADLAIQQLESFGDERFFLWVHFFDPHWPYDPPEPYAGRHENPYDGEIAFMDAELGRVLDSLKRLKLEGKTLVVAVGDHGEGLGEHQEDAHSFFVYETAMHVPLVLRCPGRLAAGRVVQQTVRTVDVMPTILEFLGESDALTSDIDGKSVLASLSQTDAGPARESYGETLRPKEVFDYAPLRSLLVERWKYIHAPTPELYNLADDPDEMKNLAAAEPQRVADLRERLRDLIEERKPPYWLSESAQPMSDEERARLEALGYATGNTQAAAGERGEMANFEPTGSDMKDHPEVVRLWSFATAAWQARQYEAAEQLYAQLVERVPTVMTFRVRLAKSRAHNGKPQEAIATLEAALKVAPDDASIREALHALRAQGGTTQPASGLAP